MIATHATTHPVWDRVGIEFSDDNGRTVSAEINPGKALELSQDIAEVANAYKANDIVARWAIGPTSPVKSRIGKGFVELHWNGRHRNKLRIHGSRLREIADTLHDLADQAEG